MNKSLQYLLISFGVLFLLYLINESQQTKYKSSIESIFDVDENDIGYFSSCKSMLCQKTTVSCVNRSKYKST